MDTSQIPSFSLSKATDPSPTITAMSLHLSGSPGCLAGHRQRNWHVAQSPLGEGVLETKKQGDAPRQSEAPGTQSLRFLPCWNTWVGNLSVQTSGAQTRPHPDNHISRLTSYPLVRTMCFVCCWSAEAFRVRQVVLRSSMRAAMSSGFRNIPVNWRGNLPVFAWCVTKAFITLLRT